MVSRIQLLEAVTLRRGIALLFVCYIIFVHVILLSWNQPKEINDNMSLDNITEDIRLKTTPETGSNSSRPEVSATSVGPTAAGNKTTSVAPVNNGTKENLLSSIYKEGHLISNSNLCPDFGDGVKIIILITSAPDHYQARLAIRLTWGHFGQRSDIELAFVVGTTSNNEAQAHIESESKLYGDIIQGHFVDTYENLTLKTLSMLEWVGRYCYKAHFFLKTDDDMFINVPKLLHFAETKWSDNRTIFGNLAVRWSPNRDPKNQYYISHERFAPSVFPDFTTGPAYLVTMDSVHDLYERTLQHAFVNLEDVLVTGIIAEDLQIARVGVNGFVKFKINQTKCELMDTYSVHWMNYETQIKLWAISMSLEKCPDLPNPTTTPSSNTSSSLNNRSDIFKNVLSLIKEVFFNVM